MKYFFIYIEWCNVMSKDIGWFSFEDAMVNAESADWIIKQSGFLVKETDECIVLAQKLNEQEDVTLFEGLMKIPKVLIKKRIDLGKHIMQP